MMTAGWIMSGLFAAFMLLASVVPKLIKHSSAIDSLTQLDWPVKYLTLIAMLELAGVAFFLYPATSLLGAIMFTGILGGALASHLRSGSPLYSHNLFSTYLGFFMWLALWLRDPEFRIAVSLLN